jgi:hypothetical protein
VEGAPQGLVEPGVAELVAEVQGATGHDPRAAPRAGSGQGREKGDADSDRRLRGLNDPWPTPTARRRGCFVRVVPGPAVSDSTVLHPHGVGPEIFQSRPLIAAEHLDPGLGKNQVSGVDDVSASHALEMDEIAVLEETPNDCPGHAVCRNQIRPASAASINPGINLRTAREKSDDLAGLELMPEQVRDRCAVDLITRRSRVRIPPPLLEKGPQMRPFLFAHVRISPISRLPAVGRRFASVQVGY